MLKTLTKIAAEQDGTPDTDVLLTVNAGGNHWIRRGQIEVDADDLVVRLFHTVQSLNGQVARPTEWPAHALRTGSQMTATGHTDRPVHIRLAAIIAVESAETDHKRR